MSDLTRYRHVDGMGGDWEEHAELMKHTKTGGSYEMRYSDPTDTMPDGVVVVRDYGGDIDSFMVPDDSLQQIADAWRQYTHAIHQGEYGKAEQLHVQALLDGLVEGNEDEH